MHESDEEAFAASRGGRSASLARRLDVERIPPTGPTAGQAPAGGVSPLAAVPDATDSPGPSDSPPDGPADPTPGKRPHLRVVK